MSTSGTPSTGADQDPTPTGTPLVRRRLLAIGGSVAAGVVGSVVAADGAAAAPATQAWLAGGNTNITNDGTNFIGTKNVAPIIFKTPPGAGGTPVERMRVTPGGKIGIGLTTPAFRLDVKAVDLTAIQGVSTGTTSAATGVGGVADVGFGVTGSSASNTGVKGTGGYAGVQGQGGSYGSISTGSSVGAYGNGADYGVYGVGGTYGSVSSGTDYGAYGSGATGVRGTGSTYGVHGTTSNPNSDAVRGEGGQWGVHGVGGRTAGVIGESGYVGTWGQATSYGVYGLATDTVNVSYGLFGQASNGASYAMYAQGNARVTGTLSKSAGSFQIDHPLDPENQWLSHSFVESPDMMNVYNGVAVLDANGEATVTLPAYFEALNRDFRYQLTAVGAAAPSLHVKSKVRRNRFAIAGGHAGLEVSWQVTGVRQDAYAKAHPIVVEKAKKGAERGTRDFVPAGSAARQFQVHPPAPAAAPVVHEAPAPALPTLRD